MHDLCRRGPAFDAKFEIFNMVLAVYWGPSGDDFPDRHCKFEPNEHVTQGLDHLDKSSQGQNVGQYFLRNCIEHAIDAFGTSIK